MSIARMCMVQKCERKHSGRGYCEAHLIRVRKYGNPLPDKPLEERSYHRSKYPFEYKIYRNIKSRLTNPNNPHYKNYGGRGLTMDKEFEHSFIKFIEHVGARPEKHLTLDRIDNDKGYTRGNMRWTTRSVQTYNQRVKKTNTTGYTGVSKLKSGRYIARVGVNGKKINLGVYDDASTAGAAVSSYRLKVLKSLNAIIKV